MRKFKSILALALSASFLVGMTACSGKETPAEETVEPVPEIVQYSEKATTVQKSETVYVSLDKNGNETLVQVTDWLHTDKGEVAVQDVSDLQNISDINGNVQPVTNGKNVTWHMPTTDLYYKGVSDKKTPVHFSVEYKLNGKKISADKIAGKSGTVEMHISMKNICEKDGVYLPVIAAGLMMLPDNVFTNVEVENGISVSDGTKQIVVGIGMPGMAESLGLTESSKIGSISIADSFTVRAKTECFSLDNQYFAVLPVCSMNPEALFAGSNAEASAFFSVVEGLLGAIGSMDKNELAKALSSENISEIADMLSQTISLYQKNAALISVLSKYATKENMDNLSKLVTALQDPKTMKMLEDLNSPLLKGLLRGLPELLDATQALLPTMEALQKDLKDPEIQQALEELPETLKSLSKILDTLSRNSAVLQVLGSDDSNSLFGAVSNALKTGNGETILTDLVQNSDKIMPELERYIEFGRSYGLFTDSAEGTDISLLFIYTTEALHPVAETEKTEPTTQALPWYKKIF